ncbi:MAG: PqqD family protein [Clostridia bacterium]|nr:PqqD family protein [Clostridia bacterium]
MKLTKGFVIHDTGDEIVMVATGAAQFSGMIRLNKTAAFIANCLLEETTEDAIVEAMLEKYDADRALIAKNVADVIEKFRSVGAVEG